MRRLQLVPSYPRRSTYDFRTEGPLLEAAQLSPAQVKQGKWEPPQASGAARELVAAMLAMDPKARPAAADALQFSWLQQKSGAEKG